MKKGKLLIASLVIAVGYLLMFQSTYAQSSSDTKQVSPQEIDAFDQDLVKEKLRELFPTTEVTKFSKNDGRVVVPLNVNEPLVLNFDDGSSITYQVKTVKKNAASYTFDYEVNKIYEYSPFNYADISIRTENATYDGNRHITPSPDPNDTYQWINSTILAEVEVGSTTAKGVVSGGSTILEAKGTGKIKWQIPIIGGTTQTSYAFGLGVDPLIGFSLPYLIEY
ncbi:hypothetical protein IM700_019710 [Paenibacillus sp. DXFW5]|uniref:Uncharacterized protein n=1 Tax=Paenibacillus rhizolycopersici TaxID=2780073 RepID=A0ABS2HDI3_9BACL|nr:hypothetical protein [Paenibacillus rhizolycopersici]MBM6997896.1 hypothetical protein [Paenibacillus rhizolycopersici]